jgi:16S rRNA (cytosine1402-N4)-methyltransferase
MPEPDAEIESVHRPVMLREVLEMLKPERGGYFIDATLGIGGHTEAILGSSPDTGVLGIDQDPQAIELATERLKGFESRIRIREGNFADISRIAAEAGLISVDGILADLGVSSLQMDSETRGFSFRFDAPLDMRMGGEGDLQTAAELLETMEQEDLANVIYKYGEERASRKIAKWIIERRERGDPIRTTFQLAELVRRAVPRKPRDKIDPATRTFQALRIAVNDELGILETFISDAVGLLKTEGVLAIITFHSLEDRIVKHTFQKLSGRCQCPPRMPQCICGAEKLVEVLTRKPITASEIENIENPRARSAKLRACRKLGPNKP